MAIMTPGPLAGRISGRIGGNDFRSTRWGQVVQKKAQRLKVYGPEITRTRRRMQDALLQWQVLTDNQRTAWDTAAKTFPNSNRLGVATRLSGHQLFLKVNVQFYPFITFSEGIWANTPVDLRRLPPKRPTGLDFTSGGPYLIEFEVPTPTSNSAWLIAVGRPFNDRAYRSWNTWKMNQAITTGSPPDTPITNGIQSEYGDFITGERIFLRIHSQVIGAQPILAGILSTIVK